MRKYFNIPLTKEQEKGLLQFLEKRIETYLWIPVFLLLLFQVYNITYVCIYTGFEFQSQASKIYFLLYMFMFIVCLISLLGLFIVLKSKKRKVGRLLLMQNIFVVVLLAWGITLSIYDQRVSENVSVYVTSMLSIAVLAYMPPKFFISLFVGAQAIMILGVILFESYLYGDSYGVIVNTVWMTVMALFISSYHYVSERKNYKNLCIISEKNQEIVDKSEELDFIAHHDALTGVWNRRFLNEYLLEMLKKDMKSLGVCMLDIDNFKQYNDTFGHLQGDICLQKIAQAIESNIERGKLVRFGGEEFIYVISNAQEDTLMTVCEEIQECVKNLEIKAPEKGCVTVSIGSTFGLFQTMEDWNTIMGKADQALYEAKNTGKSKSVFLSCMK